MLIRFDCIEIQFSSFTHPVCSNTRMPVISSVSDIQQHSDLGIGFLIAGTESSPAIILISDNASITMIGQGQQLTM